MTTKTMYGRDDGLFCFDDINSLYYDLAATGDLHDGSVYYEANCERLSGADFVDIQDVTELLERWDDHLNYNFVDDASSYFSDVTDDAKNELVDVLRAWIDKHVNVARYLKIVGDTKKCNVMLTSNGEITE